MGTSFSIERHPPERGQRVSAAAPAGGCCCCCCCLHAVGGLVGAAVARPKKTPPPAVPIASADGKIRAPTNSATKVYWTLMAIVAALVAAGSAALIEREAGWWVLLVYLPVVQLGVSLLAAIALAVTKRGNRRERLLHLGKITLYGILGAVVGGLLVIGLFGLW